MAADTKASAKALWAHTPIKGDEALAPLQQHEGFVGQESSHPDSAPDNAARKRFETIRARLAMVGHTLERRPDGGYTISRWGLQRGADDLDEVEAFARLAGALR